MDIKKYELFIDVAETGNFTKSAERIGYTQSGVSHLLKSLENEVGFPLFIRSKKGVTLTQSGENLLPLVRELLASNEKIEQTIEEIKGYEIGKIYIGTFTSVSISWLPQIIYEFEKKYPSITISIKEGGTDEIEQWIDDHTIDIGFLSERHTKPMDFLPLYEDPLVAIVPLDHERAKDEYLSMQEIHEKPFIISTIGTDYDIHHALSDANIKPAIKYSCTDDHAIVSMVANHLGISILPELIVKDYGHEVAIKKLNPYYSRVLGIGYRSKEYLSPAANKFVDFAKEYILENFVNREVRNGSSK